MKINVKLIEYNFFTYVIIQNHYMKNMKINSSLMHILKAKMRQKFGIKTINENSVKITGKGMEDGFPYIKLDNGKIFFHRFFKSPLTEVNTRYKYSHYEIDKKPHPKFGVHLNHIDNLHNLKINENVRKDLLDKLPIKSGDIVLELGAFCGFGTMKISEMVGEKGKVIAVEADKINYKILEKNIVNNNLKNVKIINKGIWNSKGKLSLFKESNQRNSLVKDLLSNIESKEKIEVDTVDNILKDLEIESVDFVTMEINAAEIEALQGMNKVLSQKNIRIIAAGWYEYEGKEAWRKIKEILEEFGFTVYIGVQNRIFAYKDQ